MRIIIAGAGEVGSHLAKMLSNESNDITVIDSDQSRLDALASNTDIVTVTGSSSEIKVLKEAGVADSDLFIAVNPSESQDVNIISAILAKKLGSHKVTARINTEDTSLMRIRTSSRRWVSTCFSIRKKSPPVK